MIADGDEGPPQARTGDVVGHHGGDDQNREGQGQIATGLVELIAEQLRHAHIDALRAVEQRRKGVARKPGNDELRGQGGHDQVEALDPQRGQAEEQANQAGADRRGG